MKYIGLAALILPFLVFTPVAAHSAPDINQELMQTAPAALLSVPGYVPAKGVIESPMIIKQERGESISFNARKLINNVWGAPAGEKLASAVFLKDNKDCGYSWSRLDSQKRNGLNDVLPIYPEVRVGGSPWDKSANPVFPILLKDIKNLTFEVTYDYPVTPTGRFNFSYDVFFIKSDKPAASPVIDSEVMIWMDYTADQPQDKYRGEFSDGQHTYKLYSWVMADGRNYYAFLLQGESRFSGNHSVNALKLIDALNLNPALYMHGVDIGNEVWHGKGEINIQKLAVNLNGQPA